MLLLLVRYSHQACSTPYLQWRLSCRSSGVIILVIAAHFDAPSCQGVITRWKNRLSCGSYAANAAIVAATILQLTTKKVK
jgi:hypothetical protein